MAKGDKYEVYLRGVVGPLPIEAKKAGRKLTIDFSKEGGTQWLNVLEQTWTGKTVAMTRFNASEILAITSNFEQEE